MMARDRSIKYKYKDKTHLNKRQWLRPLGDGGDTSIIAVSVVSSISTGYNPVDKTEKNIGTSIEANFTLKDCSRTMSFGFFAENKRSFARQMKALNKMFNAIKEMRDTFEQLGGEYYDGK